jgi:hypothetical protein
MGQMQGNLYAPARSDVGQASKSTAKRGWIKRWPATDNRKYRAGPDAAGATRNRDGSNAAGATRSTAVSSETLERAGRRPALSFPGSRSGSIVPKGPMTPSSPGLTASFLRHQEWRSGQGCLSLRRASGDRDASLAVPQEEGRGRLYQKRRTANRAHTTRPERGLSGGCPRLPDRARLAWEQPGWGSDCRIGSPVCFARS